MPCFRRRDPDDKSVLRLLALSITLISLVWVSKITQTSGKQSVVRDIAVLQAVRVDVPPKIFPILELSSLVYTHLCARIIFQLKNYLHWYGSWIKQLSTF